jgi:zinc transporter, ZIP family
MILFICIYKHITFSVQVHNIPEGLAVALVMMPCGVSFVDTFLWAVFTSIPQPIIAVPAFIFMEQFEPLLVIGLGFAAGAMLFVAVMELIPDATEKLPNEAALAITTLSFGIMTLIQWEAANVI